MDTVSVFIYSTKRANTLTHSLLASQIWDSQDLKQMQKTQALMG